jgi:hypothetical protein
VSATTAPLPALDGSPKALMDGFHAAILVSLTAAALGVAAVAMRRRARAVPCPEPT